ncbi:MAG: type II secretion system F family protein [Candidatus Diapherotrites archaeon]
MIEYRKYLKAANLKVSPAAWIGMAVIVSLVVGTFVYLLSSDFLARDGNIILSAVFSLAIADLIVGFPYLLASRRIDEIEDALPDALKQMADTLKSGGTYEYALREVATAEYGALKDEMANVLTKLEEGENFETALTTLSDNIDSRIVKRTVTIIVDSVRAGAGLADILEDIAEDVRAIHRINRERKSRTLMQAAFMFTAGGIVAPAIFGFVDTIIKVLTTAARGVGSAEIAARIPLAIDAASKINLGIQIFIVAQAAITSVMISLMREGKPSKSIIYFPLLLFIAYSVYLVAQVVSVWLIGSTGGMAL